MNVLAVVDDVAEVDADAKIEGAFSKALLHFNAAFDGFVHGRELGQETIAGELDDPSRVGVHRGVDHVIAGLA